MLYAAIEQGHWAIALVGTAASIVAAYYYLVVIQRVCLEHPARRIELGNAPALALPIAWLLAAVTALISVFPLPFQHVAEALAGAVAGVPEFESPLGGSSFWFPTLAHFAVYGLGHVSTRARDIGAVILAPRDAGPGGIRHQPRSGLPRFSRWCSPASPR